MSLWVNRPSSSVNVYLFSGVVQPNTVTSSQTWFVLEHGDALYCNGGGEPLDLWVSGSALTGSPPF